MDSLRNMMAKVIFKEHATDSVDWKKIGNEHLTSRRYKDAIAAYTKGIEGGDSSIETLANRSSAYLHISDYKRALADAELALSIDNTHIKCIYRKVKALFGMAFYRDAIKFLGNISLDSYSQYDREIITGLITEGERFASQSENGEYPWGQIYMENRSFLEIAEYTGPVIVKDASMKGRGLFATKVIEAGELVLATRAFSKLKLNCFNTPFSANQQDLVFELKKLLMENPENHEIIGRLYAGPELDYLTPTADKSSSIYVNKKRMEYITIYNAIASNDGCLGNNLGIWIIPSYINHSCVDANCAWVIVGDFFFLRAWTKISEGEEIMIAYKTPDKLIAQEGLDFYHFICQCRLCRRDRMDSEFVKAQRKDIFDKLNDSLRKFGSYATFQKKYDIEIQNLLKLFDESRSDAPELNTCMATRLYSFAKDCFMRQKFIKGIASLEKVYNLTKNVAAYKLLNTVTCLCIASSCVLANEKIKARSWVEVLKKDAILFYGSLQVLEIYPETALIKDYLEH